MKQIGYFSIFCLISTLASITLIVVLEVKIFRDPTYASESMKTPLQESHLDYNYLDWR